MTELKATPGPWRCEGADDFGDWNILHDGDALAIAAVVRNMRDIHEVEANAHLIAATPALYDSLLDVVESYRSYRRRCHDDETSDSIEGAEATLSQARGETP